MAASNFVVGDPNAVQRWAAFFAQEPEKHMALTKYMGSGENACIVVLRDLEKGAGEKITVPLFMKMTGDGVEGDNIIADTTAEEALATFNDYLFIDQRRKGTKTKGKMAEQRVLYNMRERGRTQLASWFAEDYDAQLIMYLSGARGIDTTMHVPLSWSGRASNPLQGPDPAHLMHAGAALGASDTDASCIMSIAVIDKIIAKVETIDPAFPAIDVGQGEKKFVCLMHPFQAYDLRKSVSNNDWIDIHKHADGKNSLIYQNALGEHNGVVLAKHRNVVRFSNYGAGSNLGAARALVLGAQCGMIAWGGSAKGVNRYSWNEETYDRGNGLAITIGAIFGAKGAVFNGAWYGRLAIDTYAADPTN
jgi:N4-gp56 family major capsid protein